LRRRTSRTGNNRASASTAVAEATIVDYVAKVAAAAAMEVEA